MKNSFQVLCSAQPTVNNRKKYDINMIRLIIISLQAQNIWDFSLENDWNKRPLIKIAANTFSVDG